MEFWIHLGVELSMNPWGFPVMVSIPVACTPRMANTLEGATWDATWR
jgi:hypothetical protein